MLVLNILIFISALLISYSLLTLIIVRPSAIERLEKYFKPHTETKTDLKPKLSNKIQPRKILNILGDRLNNIEFAKRHIRKIQQELIKAGLPLKGEEFLVIQSMVFLCVFFFIFNVSGSTLVALAYGIVGWVFPKLIVNVKKNKRYKLFNEQLSDAIVLISNSLKAGHSFLQAVDSVAREMPEPISREFEKVLREMRLGVTTEKALENLLARVESDDLELMITAVIIQRQIGGNLSEILDTLSNTIRERVKLKGEIRTLTAQGRLSGTVISLLPIVIGMVIYTINPEYLMELFRSSIGIFIISVAVISQIIGILLINKIVKIEV